MSRKRIHIKLIASGVLLLTCFTAKAQKIGVAVKAGGGLAYQHIDNPDVLAVSTVSAFSFGGMATYPLPSHFVIQGGLNVSSKGALITEDAVTTRQRVINLDLPVSFVREIDAPGLGKVYIGAGGYFARAIGGNVDYTTPSSETSDKLEFGRDLDLLPYDAGLNFTTGLRLNNKLIFDISYQYGLKNIATTRQTDTGTDAIKSRMFAISLGYTIR